MRGRRRGTASGGTRGRGIGLGGRKAWAQIGAGTGEKGLKTDGLMIERGGKVPWIGGMMIEREDMMREREEKVLWTEDLMIEREGKVWTEDLMIETGEKVL